MRKGYRRKRAYSYETTDITNVQINFFSHLYKQKINSEEMEEKNRHFYEKHSNSNKLGNSEK